MASFVSCTWSKEVASESAFPTSESGLPVSDLLFWYELFSSSTAWWYLLSSSNFCVSLQAVLMIVSAVSSMIDWGALHACLHTPSAASIVAPCISD